MGSAAYNRRLNCKNGRLEVSFRMTTASNSTEAALKTLFKPQMRAPNYAYLLPLAQRWLAKRVN